jgi:hypothetical protein
VRLKPTRSPWAGVLPQFFFTLGWNGAIAGFIAVAWPHRRETPLAPQLIFGLFAPIGLGLVLGLVSYAVTAVFTTVPVVELGPQPLRPGEPVQGRLVKRAAAPLKSLELALVGDKRSGGSLTKTLLKYTPEQDPNPGPVLDRNFALTLPTSTGPERETYQIILVYDRKAGGSGGHAYAIQVAQG